MKVAYLNKSFKKQIFTIFRFFQLTRFSRYRENCSSENYPQENFPPEKWLLRKYPLWVFHTMKAPPCENYHPEICTRENCPQWKFSPEKIIPHKIPSPLINHTNERKIKTTKFFTLQKAVQHNILIKITKVLFDTQMISQKILGLDTFFTEWKKSKNRTKAKIAKWHLLASCTSQGELKLGSQIIKFGKYVKLLNSQLSLHIHLWI